METAIPKHPTKDSNWSRWSSCEVRPGQCSCRSSRSYSRNPHVGIPSEFGGCKCGKGMNLRVDMLGYAEVRCRERSAEG